MCPLCIGTATLIVSGGASAGGLAAVVLKRLGRQSREVVCGPSTGEHRNSRTGFNLHRPSADGRGRRCEQTAQPLP